MEITIVRHTSTRWGIDGHLSINRQLVCDTVEHPRFHLPAGVYTISSLSAESMSPLSGADHSEGDLPSPFRHGDGAWASRHGEIIVGKTTIPGLVTQSQATYDRLYERLKKVFQRGTTVRLKIVG